MKTSTQNNKSLFYNFLTPGVATILLSVAALQTNIASANTEQVAIVGGNEVASPNQYPFMAALVSTEAIEFFQGSGEELHQAQFCGGTLIADRWVLTAAHCLFSPFSDTLAAAEEIGVVLGRTNLIGDGVVSEVANIYVHPDYNAVGANKKNDIGLIELSAPYTSTLAILPTRQSSTPNVNESGTVIGWGVTREESSDSPPRLREVDLPTISSARCISQYGFDQYDPRLSFCAGGLPTGGVSACFGDSGGPVLVLRDGAYVVAGVVSGGDSCSAPNVPGVYSRVSRYTSWINSIATGTIEYAGQQGIGSTIQPRQLVVDNAVSGFVGTGQAEYYSVIGAGQINLRSTTGDADLFIIDVPDMERIDSVRCISEQFDPFDSCVLNDTGNVSYAVVYGFSGSEYTIWSQEFAGPPTTANNTSTVQPVTVVETPSSSGGGNIGLSILLLSLLRLRRKKTQPLF